MDAPQIDAFQSLKRTGRRGDCVTLFDRCKTQSLPLGYDYKSEKLLQEDEIQEFLEKARYSFLQISETAWRTNLGSVFEALYQ